MSALRFRPFRAQPVQLPTSRLGAIALFREISTGLVQRPGRSILTVLGTVLGVGSLVAIVGLTATAQGQISERFSVLDATGVDIEQVEGAGADITGGEPYIAFPEDAQDRVEALNGVKNAGVWWPLNFPSGSIEISAHPPEVARIADGSDLAVYAVSPGAIEASDPTWKSGYGYDAFHQVRGEKVAVLGATAAHHLGIERLDTQPAVFIDGTAFTVVGILGRVQRNKEFLLSVMVPSSTAVAEWGVPKGISPKMTVETVLGGATQIARQAPLALREDRPEYFRAIAPPDPHSLERRVSDDLTSLFLILAGISLIIGAFGIANTTLVAVLERIPEIGLRRALGARPRHVALQFLAESAVLGLVGGIVGTAIGVGVVVGVSISKDWSAIMPTWLMGGPLLGAFTGLVAGLYPAWRATRVEPMEALRR